MLSDGEATGNLCEEAEEHDRIGSGARSRQAMGVATKQVEYLAMLLAGTLRR